MTGIDPPANVRRLATPAVEFVGQVESLPEFYASVRVVVVPIRYGSGVKLKTVEAVQYGVPTVSTVVGAEGISLDDRGAIVVADDPDRFAGRGGAPHRRRSLARAARAGARAAGPLGVGGGGPRLGPAPRAAHGFAAFRAISAVSWVYRTSRVP